MYHFLALSMYFIVASLYVLTTHVTVCVCHAQLKGFLLTCLIRLPAVSSIVSLLL